jgi:PKD repeat protein
MSGDILKKMFILLIALLNMNVLALACENGQVYGYKGNSTGNLTIVDFWTENCNRNGTAPFSTNFISNVQGNVTRWQWTFEPVDDDYYSKHPRTARHTFHESGNYTITLEVWGHGKYDKLVKTNYIQVQDKKSSICSPAENKSVPGNSNGTINNTTQIKPVIFPVHSQIKSVFWEFEGCYVTSTIKYINGTVSVSRIPMPML